MHKTSKNLWLVVANVSVGTFMSTLDASVVNVALPTIGRELQAPVTFLQWVVTAYLVTIASTLLVFGRLSDVVGRKKVYATGFIIFTTGSLLCGFAPGAWYLILFRVLQGLGASMMMSNALALITQVFPEEKRGRALGISSMVVSLGMIAGPALGGMLAGLWGWRFIFWINVPLGITGSVLALYILPAAGPAKKESLDWPGALVFAAGINCLLFLSVILNGAGWNVKTVALLLAAPLSCAAFYRREKAVKSPLVDMELFSNRIFAAGTAARLLVFLAQYPVMFLLPFYLQLVKYLPPQQVGLLMVSYPAAMAVFGLLSGRLSERLSPRLLTVAGPLVLASGLAVMALLNAGSSVFTVILGLVLVGTGMGIFQPPNNSLIMGSVPSGRLSIANALISVMRNIGTITGVAVSVLVFSLNGAGGGVTLSGGARELLPGTIVDVVNSTMGISLVIILCTVVLLGWVYRLDFTGTQKAGSALPK